MPHFHKELTTILEKTIVDVHSHDLHFGLVLLYSLHFTEDAQYQRLIIVMANGGDRTVENYINANIMVYAGSALSLFL